MLRPVIILRADSVMAGEHVRFASPKEKLNDEWAYVAETKRGEHITTWAVSLRGTDERVTISSDALVEVAR